MKKVLIAAAALAASATFAIAQEAATPAPADFATVDADKSGKVSVEEAKAAMSTMTDDAFKAADADQSGDLSEEEFKAVAG